MYCGVPSWIISFPVNFAFQHRNLYDLLRPSHPTKYSTVFFLASCTSLCSQCITNGFPSGRLRGSNSILNLQTPYTRVFFRRHVCVIFQQRFHALVKKKEVIRMKSSLTFTQEPVSYFTDQTDKFSCSP